ncbi:uncharacterized protein LOC132200453 [Neocloeon triangulifer]|uniref:uncharacterized protein LOC132200453 n=1 Tax=Neocloeon triangulifer TaxID=2078957 RepID=UPI00286F8B28|nr:uncharacterized protein LOC132200453 [Neocloeon triangulifer]
MNSVQHIVLFTLVLFAFSAAKPSEKMLKQYELTDKECRAENNLTKDEKPDPNAEAPRSFKCYTKCIIEKNFYKDITDAEKVIAGARKYYSELDPAESKNTVEAKIATMLKCGTDNENKSDDACEYAWKVNECIMKHYKEKKM